MSWLTNWDDIIHGTVVFSAIVPCCIAALLAWKLPPRLLWIAIAAGMAVPLLWFFGLPDPQRKSSEDAMVAGLVVAVLLAAVELSVPRLPWKFFVLLLARILLWVGLVWLLYPAWLAEDGGNWKKLLLRLAIGASIGGWATMAEFLLGKNEAKGAPRVSLAAFLPASIALAFLLQFGGALQFAQSAGALAACVGAVSLLAILKPKSAGSNSGDGNGCEALAAFWGMLFGLLAWSGWLFAEIHKPAAIALAGAPIFALAARKVPLPRHNPFLVQLWDGLASAIIAGIAIWLAWAKYNADSAGYEGY